MIYLLTSSLTLKSTTPWHLNSMISNRGMTPLFFESDITHDHQWKKKYEWTKKSSKSIYDSSEMQQKASEYPTEHWYPSNHNPSCTIFKIQTSFIFFETALQETCKELSDIFHLLFSGHCMISWTPSGPLLSWISNYSSFKQNRYYSLVGSFCQELLLILTFS